MLQRLNKFIATNTHFSRRKADELIKEGKVFINDKKITTLGTIIDNNKDEVKIDNQKIGIKTEKVYLMLNKPANYVTTRKDEQNRETVMLLVPQIPNLKPIGRLDMDSEGLLLFSNDGDFINRLSHPRFELTKEYLVKISSHLNEENQKKLENGIKIKENDKYFKTSPAKIKILDKSEKSTTLTITIHEGRNRQIRKMFATIKHAVKYLKRLRIGKIQLGSLKKGSFRKLTKQEIDAYKSA